MTAERSQLYYTCVFLHVSFQAIQASVMTSSREDDTPCWLDAQLLQMLSGELQRCRQEAAPFREVSQALDTAIYHCSLLMAQCPASVNRRLCQHHLEAIMSPLKLATDRLSGNATRATTSHASPGQRLRSWLGW
ncbi:hypothetical protein MHM84_13490 [Halomonas sp. McH1-25]|uniref:hypothetical protein n=1 Tax=unclassified Halomonas TaxID=2609666 RepID=UPI001EF5EA84|nr:MULTISPECIES: hypothetical protein [unclassified Halomonas]MCG7600799.1 hypothetical protein [Halomonas sp. McH1-25]MCP1342764.1 hypothetical protein [Halomonas sp. FL8]MCP1362852.1 hypothetical protein [Halomonas sp. BBD45]MCP1365498.1 hypothetical protein [Halomonas sp. BBD48]